MSRESGPKEIRAPRILHAFSTFAIGGPQRRFAAIANHFDAAFHHIIWPLDGCADARSLLMPGNTWEVVAEPFPKAQFFRNAWYARGLLRRLRPDVLVTYNWGAMEWAAGNILPLVRHVHIEDGFGPEEATRQLPRRVLFRRVILNRHSTVVLPSRKLVGIATDIWRISPHRLVYLPNGIPCARFEGPADAALTASFRGRGPVIGTVATLRREKNLERLIAAFAMLRATRPCHLVIAGEGPERAALEKAAAASGVGSDITFAGYIDRPERILGAFDVFAISSDTEQMPLSVLEAMAAGRPIASTDAGDIRSMVAEENRELVVPMSVPDLAGAFSKLLDDSALRERLGAANRAKSLAEFDEAAMFAAYGKLFDL